MNGDLDRREGESPTAHMLRGIFAHIAQGLDEAGMPLTAEQLAFLDNSIVSLDPRAGVSA